MGREFQPAVDPREHYVAMRRGADWLNRKFSVREEIVEWEMSCGCYLLGTLGNVQLFPCHVHGVANTA